MYKILGIIAAVIIAVAAFVAWKNIQAYDAEIVTSGQSQKAEVATKEQLKEAQELVAWTETSRDEKVAAAKVANTEFEQGTELLEVTKKEVITFKKKHVENEVEVASANELLKDLPDPDELIPQLKGMQAAKSEALSKAASQEAVLGNLIQLDTASQARIAKARRLIDLQSSGKSFPSLNTRISSVYRNWGFVILSAGDTQGVVSGSKLDVLRNGELIGKLKVTAVEAGRASADIILDSVAEGITLRSGDTVVSERG